MSLALTEKFAPPGSDNDKPFVSRRWAVLLLCVFLAGCSATRIVYNKLDWILVWYISDFFTLDDAQQDHLEIVLESNLDWHRRDQLPKYAQLLREIEREFSADVVTLEMLERYYAHFMVLWDEFIVQTTPDMTEFFRTLSQEQVDEFIANLEESNQELWEEYAGKTSEERQERRQKSTIEGLERFFGRLSVEQEELILSYQASLHDVSLEWMASRRQWQQDFHDLIVERPSEPEFSDRMMRLMLEPNGDDSPEYRRRVEENRQTIMAMMVALSADLKDKQRKRFSKNLKKNARNFEILVGQKT
jgi:hypothetical protein